MGEEIETGMTARRGTLETNVAAAGNDMRYRISTGTLGGVGTGGTRIRDEQQLLEIEVDDVDALAALARGIVDHVDALAALARTADRVSTGQIASINDGMER